MANAVLPSVTSQTQTSSITMVPATQEADTQRSSIDNETSRRIVNETAFGNEARDSDGGEELGNEASTPCSRKRIIEREPGASSSKKRCD